MIRITCPGCGASLHINEDQAGKPIACPRCSQRLSLRKGPASAPAVAASSTSSLVDSSLPSSPRTDSLPKQTSAAQTRSFMPQGPASPHAGKAEAPSSQRSTANEEAATLPPAPQAADEEAATLPPVDAGTATVSFPPVSGPSAGPQPMRLGSYEILGELGRGGMGVVYKARDLRLKRLAALKMVLAGGHAGEAELARFRTEAEAVARLQHPNIVQIHEVGTHDGLPFFALEFCSGGSLADYLQGTPLPARKAAELVQTLAQAMEAAHRAGVIHRDLKPANVLLAPRADRPGNEEATGKSAAQVLEGYTPKITDFGLAKKLDEGGQTATGAVMGTPSYMAPEQAGGSKEIGPACDVYALGAILYEMITGRPPFKGATPLDTVMQVLSDEPVSPRQLQPSLPRDLESICLKCLEKDGRKRYEGAAALADDLRAFLDGTPIQARPVGPLSRGLKWSRRRPAVAVLLAAVVLLTLAGLGGVAWAYGQAVFERERARGEAQRADEEAERAREEADAAKKARDEMAAVLYTAQVRAASANLQAGEVFAAAGSLEATPAARRGWEYGYLLRRAEGTPLVLRHTAPVSEVCYSPDGSRLATRSEQTIRIWDASTGCPLLTIQGSAGNVYSLCYSPDGSRLAGASADRTARVWDARTGAELLTLRGHSDHLTSVCYSPDGSRLATASKDRTVRVWNARTGTELLALGGYTTQVLCLAYSPDGSRLAIGSAEGMVRVRDARTGTELFPLRTSSHHVCSVCFSPDGTRLLTACYDFTAQVWDAGSGALILTLLGHTSSVVSALFSPDGARVVTASHDHTVRVWDAHTGMQLFTLRGHTAQVLGVCYRPDSYQLASASVDETVRVWDAHSGAEPFTLRGHTAQAPKVCYSSDGSRLATASWDRTARVWDARTGAELLTLRGHSDHLTSVCFSPDGSRLATASKDRTARIWDARTGAELLILRGHSDHLTSVCFSPDSLRLATGSLDRMIRVWDAQTGAELLVFRSHSAASPRRCSVSYSPDGSRLASLSGQDRMVKVWDARTGTELFALQSPGGLFSSLCFSSDGVRLAGASSSDRTFRVWDAHTGVELLAFRGHDSGVNELHYNPDGTRLVSTGDEGATRIWDSRSGVDLVALRGYAVISACFSPDGTRLATAGRDGAVRIWDSRLPGVDGYDPWAEDEDRRRVLVPRWHQEDAAAAEKTGDWFCADWHLTRLITVEPPSSRLFAHRGYVRMQLRRDPEAAADVDRALELDSTDFQALWWKALLRLSAGDQDGYHKACAALLTFHARTVDPGLAIELPAACGWGPNAATDLGPALRLAERAVAGNPKSYNALNALGAVLLRAGRAEEAVKRLQEALAVRAGDFTCADELLLALAYHRLGKTEEARRWRERAGDWKESRQVPPSVRLWVSILRREVDVELKAR